MISVCLKADDEAALIEALRAFRDGDNWITASHYHALDVIGTLYTPGSVEGEGRAIVPTDPKPGYHANLRLFGEGETLLPSIRAEIIVCPSSPERVWA